MPAKPEKPLRDHQRDGDDLASHAPEVAQQLAVDAFTRTAPPALSLRALRSTREMRPSAEAQHAVGHAGDRRVVGDDDGGRAELRLTRAMHFEHHLAGDVVERAGRLVAQQHVGPLGDGAGDGDALLLAAGQLRREVVEAVGRARRASSASSGAIGSSAISVTSATFSRAVRLGIRL